MIILRSDDDGPSLRSMHRNVLLEGLFHQFYRRNYDGCRSCEKLLHRASPRKRRPLFLTQTQALAVVVLAGVVVLWWHYRVLDKLQ